MDCQMPNMDGFSATAAIREWEKEHNVAGLTPIIAVTADVAKIEGKLKVISRISVRGHDTPGRTLEPPHRNVRRFFFP